MSVSFCWQCGKALKLPFVSEYIDPAGHSHRVHKVCLKTLNAQRPVTAQPMHEAIGLGTYSSRKEEQS